MPIMLMSPRRWLAVLAIVLGCAAAANAAPPAEQVFFAFDDQNVAWHHNLRLTLVPAEKHPANPVLRVGDQGAPDYGHAILYGTVVKDGDRFRMWYLAMMQRELEKGQAPGWWRPMCYAESTDGIHWTKPELGLVELNGNTQNNICLIEAETPSMALVNDFLSVMIDDADPDPERRYKAAYIAHMPDADIKGGMSDVGWHERRVGALVCATSADGLRWKVVGDRPANAGGERFEVTSLYRHGDFYYSSGQLASPWCWLPDGRPAGRVMLTYRSADFVHWSQAKALSMVLPEQYDLPQPTVEEMLGGKGKQMHMGVGVWDRTNVLVGVPGIWQGTPDDRPAGAARLQGLKIDLGLALSNDGVHFRQPIPNFKLIEHGAEDEWDSVALLQGHAFVNEGDRTYLWYSHWDAEGQFRSQEIGLATLRRDGFGYLSRHDAGDPGHCITSVIEPAEGQRVYLNVSATEAAPVTVELLDHLDRPIEGYSGAAAARVTTDGTRIAVSWPGQSAPPMQRYTLKVGLPDDDAARFYAAYVVVGE